MKTNFFTDTKAINEFNLISRQTDYDLDLWKVEVDAILDYLDIAFLIYNSHTNPDIVNSEEVSEFYEFISDSGVGRDLAIANVCYLDRINNLDYSLYRHIYQHIEYGVLFKKNSSTALFATTIKHLIEDIGYLKEAAESFANFDFKTSYETSFNIYLRNLNFCILFNLQLYRIKDFEIESSLQSYLIQKNVDPSEFIKPYMDYYTSNKPTLSYLDNNPELYLKISEIVSERLLFELTPLSDYVTSEEWDLILQNDPGIFAVDDDFINELSERYKEDQAAKITDGGEE